MAKTAFETAAPPRYRPLHVLNGALLVLMWTFTIGAYGSLPEQIPGNMGLTDVTRWEPRDRGTWLLMPLLATFHAFLAYALSGIANASPHGFNMPQKKRLLALSRDGQRYAMEAMRAFMFGMATWLLVLTLYMQWRIFAAALAGDAGFGAGWTVALVAFALLPVPGVLWLSRAIGRRVQAWEASTRTHGDG